MSNEVITNMIRYGTNPCTTVLNDWSNIAEAVKILHPKGGVTAPTAA